MEQYGYVTFGILYLLVSQKYCVLGKRTEQKPICYDPKDKNDLRLWDGRAPGAIGDDPCKDIPFIKLFLPNGSAPKTDVGIVLYPGGGYNLPWTNTKEQEPVARYFADKIGITTFIMYYRLVQKNGTYRYPVPMWDGQRAIRHVRSNAGKYKINPAHIGAFGFSAGGHLASTLALHADQNFASPSQDSLDKTDAQPDFLGLGYPVISMDPRLSNNSMRHLLHGYAGKELGELQDFLSGQKHVTQRTPQTFIFESKDDKTISAQNSILFAKALKDAGVPNEAHIFEHGLHGDGLATNEPEESVWPMLFQKWLAERKIISSSKTARL